MECFTACALAPSDDPTKNIAWVSLIGGRNVPPKLDFMHGLVQMADAAEREWILGKFATFPGGLREAEKVPASLCAVHHFFFR